MKKSLLPLKNSDGFLNVLLLVLLPVLIVFLSLIAQLVFITELKSEFRYNCISGSLALLKADKFSPADLLRKLKSIKSLLQFSVTLTDFPDSEPESRQRSEQKVVFMLKYSGLSSPPVSGTVICGIERILKEEKWQYRNVYSIKEGKF